MNGRLERIWRYPVKSLDGEALSEVLIREGGILPHDRRFAIAHGSRSQTLDGSWANKRAFFNLMRDEKLAQLHVTFAPESGILAIFRAGRQVVSGQATTPLGRILLEQFLTAYLAGCGRGPAKLQERTELGFTDVPDPYVSILNLASLADLERVLGKPVDPRRFRANLTVTGLAPWVERSWPGQKIRIGALELQVVDSITRCAATEVNPDNGMRDLMVLKGLQRGFSHSEMGVYARVLQGGLLQPGDPVSLPNWQARSETHAIP